MTKLVISSGDPAGVGPDICIKAFGLNQKLPYTPIILGDPNLFEERAKKYGFPIKIKEYNGQEESFLSRDSFWMTPFYLKRAVKAGIPDPMSASYMMEMLEFSISSKYSASPAETFSKSNECFNCLCIFCIKTKFLDESDFDEIFNLILAMSG